MPRAPSIVAAYNARLAGLPTYQGAPCPKGHDGVRYTSNRSCVTCAREASKEADTAKATLQKRAYRARLKATQFDDILGG